MTLLLLLLVAAVLLVGYANGANDNFKAVATVYGSSTLSYRAALGLATAAQLTGSVVSVFVAGALVSAFGGKGLLPDQAVAEPSFLLAVAVGAAVTVLAATRLGLPVSTTHALIGGLVGAGLAIAPESLSWGNLGGRYAMPLLLSPVAATGLAACIYPVARAVRRKLGIEEITCVCVAERIEPVAVGNDGGLVMARTGVELTADLAGECRPMYHGHLIGVSAQRIVDTCHLGSGFALGFARGLNDTPKVLALLVAAKWSGLSIPISLGVIAVVMAAGGIIHSRRIAETLGRRITEMNRGQGFVANFVASALVIGASLLGAPVSTTHVSTGAIFGIGLWTNRTQWAVVGQILLAWIVTLPIAMAVAYLVVKTTL
jgi:PiT family inorganic phosphate transporter